MHGLWNIGPSLLPCPRLCPSLPCQPPPLLAQGMALFLRSTLHHLMQHVTTSRMESDCQNGLGAAVRQASSTV